MNIPIKNALVLLIILTACGGNDMPQTLEVENKLETSAPRSIDFHGCDSVLQLDECEILKLIGERGEYYRNCYDKYFVKLSKKTGVDFKTKFSYSTIGMQIEIDSVEFDLRNFKNKLKCRE